MLKVTINSTEPAGAGPVACEAIHGAVFADENEVYVCVRTNQGEYRWISLEAKPDRWEDKDGSRLDGDFYEVDAEVIITDKA